MQTHGAAATGSSLLVPPLSAAFRQAKGTIHSLGRDDLGVAKRHHQHHCSNSPQRCWAGSLCSHGPASSAMLAAPPCARGPSQRAAGGTGIQRCCLASYWEHRSSERPERPGSGDTPSKMKGGGLKNTCNLHTHTTKECVDQVTWIIKALSVTSCLHV